MIKSVVSISYIYFRQSSAHCTNLWIIITWIFFAASLFSYWQYLIIYLICLFKVFYWIYYSLNYICTFTPIWNSLLNIYFEITFEIQWYYRKICLSNHSWNISLKKWNADCFSIISLRFYMKGNRSFISFSRNFDCDLKSDFSVLTYK